MPDERDPKDAQPERRLMVRYPAKASTFVIRETDMMRSGLEAQLKDVSAGGLGVTMRVHLEPNEQIKLTLTNEVQRITKDTRGVVRHVTQQDDGTYYVGIELRARLTPLEVMLLRMGIPKEPEAGDTSQGVI